ncbi:MAG: hypothetical protein KF773_08215 [Deltaproteobacteria bacterium]|nr:hypothetical protein [Deltaproteobacteria bacterium]
MAGDTHYVCIVRIDGVDTICLWQSDDVTPDHVVVDADKRLLTFPSVSAARAAGTAVSSDAPASYDLDAIDAWCKSTRDDVDCRSILPAWNLIGDLPDLGSLYKALDDQANTIYDKMFHGSSLPSMTPPGAEYTPTWRPAELALLKRLLLLGLAELRARLPPERMRHG